MTPTLQVGDTLPTLTQQVTALQLFRYSAVTWNPHRIHFEESHARAEGHAGLVVHSHLRAALALRCVTEGLGPDWTLTAAAYRLRKPAYAPTRLSYSARVIDIGADSMTLQLLEHHPTGEPAFEGTATVTRTTPGNTRSKVN